MVLMTEVMILMVAMIMVIVTVVIMIKLLVIRVTISEYMRHSLWAQDRGLNDFASWGNFTPYFALLAKQNKNWGDYRYKYGFKTKAMHQTLTVKWR